MRCRGTSGTSKSSRRPACQTTAYELEDGCDRLPDVARRARRSRRSRPSRPIRRELGLTGLAPSTTIEFPAERPTATRISPTLEDGERKDVVRAVEGAAHDGRRRRGRRATGPLRWVDPESKRSSCPATTGSSRSPSARRRRSTSHGKASSSASTRRDPRRAAPIAGSFSQPAAPAGRERDRRAPSSRGAAPIASVSRGCRAAAASPSTADRDDELGDVRDRSSRLAPAVRRARARGRVGERPVPNARSRDRVVSRPSSERGRQRGCAVTRQGATRALGPGAWPYRNARCSRVRRDGERLERDSRRRGKRGSVDVALKSRRCEAATPALAYSRAG